MGGMGARREHGERDRERGDARDNEGRPPPSVTATTARACRARARPPACERRQHQAGGSAGALRLQLRRPHSQLRRLRLGCSAAPASRRRLAVPPPSHHPPPSPRAAPPPAVLRSAPLRRLPLRLRLKSAPTPAGGAAPPLRLPARQLPAAPACRARLAECCAQPTADSTLVTCRVTAAVRRLLSTVRDERPRTL